MQDIKTKEIEFQDKRTEQAGVEDTIVLQFDNPKEEKNAFGFLRLTPTILMVVLFGLYNYYSDSLAVKELFQVLNFAQLAPFVFLFYLVFFFIVPALTRGASQLLSQPEHTVKFTSKGIVCENLIKTKIKSKKLQLLKKPTFIDIKYSGIKSYSIDSGAVRIKLKFTFKHLIKDTSLACLLGVPMRIKIPIEQQSQINGILVGRVSQYI